MKRPRESEKNSTGERETDENKERNNTEEEVERGEGEESERRGKKKNEIYKWVIPIIRNTFKIQQQRNFEQTLKKRKSPFTKREGEREGGEGGKERERELEGRKNTSVLNQRKLYFALNAECNMEFFFFFFFFETFQIIIGKKRKSSPIRQLYLPTADCCWHDAWWLLIYFE